MDVTKHTPWNKKKGGTRFKKGNTFGLHGNSSHDPNECSEVRKRVSMDIFPNSMFHNIGDPPHTGLVSDVDGLKSRPRVDMACLRPIKPHEQFIPSPVNNHQNIIVDNQVMLNNWNKFNKSHMEHTPNCAGDLEYNRNVERHWGLGIEMGVKCNACTYVSTREKFYVEAQKTGKGRKAAAINIGIQVGLSKHRVANQGLKEILASANIRPPVLSAMQKSANSVNKKLISTNKQSMSQIRNRLHDINDGLGLEQDRIDIEADSSYNNPLFSGVGRTPMQAGTQTVLVVAENRTPNKQIIALETNSKLCSCHGLSRSFGPHLSNCIATVDKNQSIGNEGTFLSDAIRDINSDGLFIDNIVLDGDSNSRKCASEITQGDGSNIHVEYCIKHMSRRLEKKIKSTTFSKCMFPGRTVESRKRAKNRFAHDIGHRLAAEISSAISHHGQKLDKITKVMSNISIAIIDCYMGDCKRCKLYSFVCTGDKNKVIFRPFLDTNQHWKSKRDFITPETSDTKKLGNALRIRISKKALAGSLQNKTQNKSESAMHVIKKCWCPALTFKNNFPGRAHSAVHTLNHKPGTSIRLLCEAVGAPITGVGVYKACHSLDKVSTYNKQRSKTNKAKMERCLARQHQYQIYDDKNSVQYNKLDYNPEEIIREMLCRTKMKVHRCRVCKKKFISKYYLNTHRERQRH